MGRILKYTDKDIDFARERLSVLLKGGEAPMEKRDMGEVDRACSLIRQGIETYIKATIDGVREALGGVINAWASFARAIAYFQYEQVVRGGIQALEEGRLGTGEGQDD